MEEIPETRDLLGPFRSLIDGQAKAAAADAERQERVERAAEKGARSAAVAGDAALMDAAEVAAILNVTEDRVWALTRAGELPTVKLGRRTYRYRRAAVLAAMEALER